jgi:preprotein translocase subunit SecA
MLEIINKLFGTKSSREVKRISPLVADINRFFGEYESLSDEQLRAKTAEFKARVQEGESLDDLLPEAFAAVKSACKRLLGQKWDAGGLKVTWDMVPYDVQLIGGIVLHQGKISEMATGEGKTLVATMPLYLNALSGKGSHLVTVNDYLALRDSQWMGKIFEFLGLSVGCILSHMRPDERRTMYQADITYGTNNEFGFDYLRDNMALRPEEVVQRGHNYAIVDEVDSVLIDEARTPLIISGPVSRSTHKFDELKGSVERLVKKQNELVNRLVGEAEKLLEDESSENEYKAGEKILMAQHGAPKNKRLQKLFQEAGAKRLMQRVESDYLRDKKIPELDEQLYFAMDEQHHTIDLTEMGRQELAKLTHSDSNMFIIPDMAEEMVKIDAMENVSPESKIEMRTKLEDLYIDRTERNHNIGQLLRAHMLYERDVEYVVEDNARVIIVDEFTGRLQYGRRYSDGLHQAIEAKENVQIERETQTIATITLQNYFRLYDKLAGMTGTAETEEQEFFDIYKLEVMVIPTNRPAIRKDHDDVIYKTRKEKYDAVLSEIEENYRRGQPVLVGTTNVEVSETLARLLQRMKIPHEVLNAKHHAREAEIVARAGQPHSVTIATNMAGRGTDIKLGPGVVELGGLRILGTERHEARRIDRQLRGRSGRQGDPGSTLFFLSLEDDLMRLFGSERIAGIMDRLGVKEGEVITHSMITSSIERAQKRVETQNFAIRKHLLEYDDVMNKQREVIYERRNRVLFDENLENLALDLMDEWIENLVARTCDDGNPDAWNLEELQRNLAAVLRVYLDLNLETIGHLNREELIENAKQSGRANFVKRKAEIDPALLWNFLQGTILGNIDEEWKDHLYEMDRLKEGVGLRAYGQRDPLVEFKKEGFNLFEEMLERINQKSLRAIFQSRILAESRAPQRIAPEKMRQMHREAAGLAYAFAQAPPPQDEPRQAATASATPRPQPVQKGKTPGRNDPCPCGSGKKYKHCHGA